MGAPIVLPTTNGSIELAEATDAGRCVGCRLMGGGMMQVTVHNSNASDTAGTIASRAGEFTFKVCGNCLGQAISGRIGEYIERAQREHAERVKEQT
jgi:hypothetical protein